MKRPKSSWLLVAAPIYESLAPGVRLDISKTGIQVVFV